MILVVLYHSCVFWNGNWFTASEVQQPGMVFKSIPVWLNSFHIYGFTLVSGFIFSYLQTRKHYKNVLSMAEKKFMRLIIPFIFVCLIWIIPISQYFYHYNMIELINKYILGTAPSQLWFLLMLFDVFMLAWFTEALYKRSILNSVAVGLISYAIGFAGGRVFPNIYQIWTAFEYLPVFIVGYKLYQDGEAERVKKVVKNPLLWLALHTLTFILMYTMPDSSTALKLTRVSVGFLNHIFGAMMAFTVLQWIAQRVNYADNRLYKILSKHSMTIYLFHQQIIYLDIWYLNGRVNTVLIAVFNFFISLGVSLLVSVILSKWKVTRFLIGES